MFDLDNFENIVTLIKNGEKPSAEIDIRTSEYFRALVKYQNGLSSFFPNIVKGMR